MQPFDANSDDRRFANVRQDQQGMKIRIQSNYDAIIRRSSAQNFFIIGFGHSDFRRVDRFNACFPQECRR
jgi:hypothetical protein